MSKQRVRACHRTPPSARSQRRLRPARTPPPPRAGPSTSSRLVGTTSTGAPSSRLRVCTPSAAGALRSATSSRSGTSASTVCACGGGGGAAAGRGRGRGAGGRGGVGGAVRGRGPPRNEARGGGFEEAGASPTLFGFKGEETGGGDEAWRVCGINRRARRGPAKPALPCPQGSGRTRLLAGLGGGVAVLLRRHLRSGASAGRGRRQALSSRGGSGSKQRAPLACAGF
jgi:hypothetical protein